MAQKIKKISKKFIALVCMFTLVFSYSVVNINDSDAAAVAGSGISDALSDSRPGEYANHTIQFEYNNEGTLANGDTQTFTFTGFTQGANASAVTDFTMTVGSDGTTYGTAMTQTADYTFSNSAGLNPVYTFTWTGTGVTKLAANPFVRIVFANVSDKLPNPGAAVYTITLGGTNNYATGTTRVVILSGIAVTATVDEYITFSSTEADNAVGFGSWTGGSVATRWATSDGNGTFTPAPAGVDDPTQLQVSSNAGDGVSITVKSINSNDSAGLYSTTAAAEIPADSSTDITTLDVEGFAVYASASNMTIDEGFDHDTVSDLAVTTGNLLFASTAAGISGGTVDVEMNAEILATTAAGSYSTTVVFVATPSY
ncbi:MAG: hypothetical protein KAI71_02000 [Candidatus Pacebacteria bacterium]|nr:hypothetical protein [Candidatus Paceibacterota bacterium]